MSARLVLALVLASGGPARAAEVRGTFNTLMSGREDPRNDEDVLVIPLYELVSLEVAELDLPGTERARVVLNGWGRLQLGDDEALEETDADLALLYLDAQRGPVRFTLGRQHIIPGVGRMTLIDGANARLDAGAGLSLQGFFGWTVHPQLRHRTENWQGGGRLAFNLQPLGQLGEVGLAYLLRRQAGQVHRHELGADLVTVIGTTRWVGAAVVTPRDGDTELVEARLAGTLGAGRSFSVTLDLERVRPALFLPMSSIFTVFTNAAHDSIGLEAHWSPSPYWTLDASGHGLILDGESLGYRAALRAVTFREAARRSLIGAELRRVDELDNGYVRGRLFTGLQLLEAVRVSADTFAYRFDNEIHDTSFSLLGQLSVVCDLVDQLRIAATVAGGTTPWSEAHLEGMVRVAYGWNVDLATEAGP